MSNNEHSQYLGSPHKPSSLPLKSCLKARKSCMKRRGSTGILASPPSSPCSVINFPRRRKSQVGFGRIEIHEFPRIMGDNPSCPEGAPLSIGWERCNVSIFELEYYEIYNHSRDRKTKDKLKIPVTERSRILLEAGYSMMDIVNCTMEVSRTQECRIETNKNRKWDAVHAAIEKTTKTIKKAARRSSLLTASTAEVLISPLRAPRKKIGRLRSSDKVTLKNMQTALIGDGAQAA